jgi:hypothetical protein
VRRYSWLGCEAERAPERVVRGDPEALERRLMSRLVRKPVSWTRLKSPTSVWTPPSPRPFLPAKFANAQVGVRLPDAVAELRACLRLVDEEAEAEPGAVRDPDQLVHLAAGGAGRRPVIASSASTPSCLALSNSNPSFTSSAPVRPSEVIAQNE